MIQKIIVLFFVLILSLSCSNTGNNNTSSEANADSLQNTKSDNSIPDISGYYRLPETGCDIALTITKENTEFKYYFKGTHLDLEGVALINIEDSVCYITFDGPIGNTAPKTVSGQFKDNAITIQNTGNSINEYHYFKDCEDKYLEFKRN